MELSTGRSSLTGRLLAVERPGFGKLITDGYVYVDKTEYVYRLLTDGKVFHYLSRPRRFGKSLFLDTLNCYFDARRDLFRGLDLDRHDDVPWEKHVVLRLDLSEYGMASDSMVSMFNSDLSRAETCHKLPDTASTADPGTRLKSFLLNASAASGRGVVLLIDEYDAPLQKAWNSPEYEGVVKFYNTVFPILKANDASLRFVFIAGCARFKNVSLFSLFNNLVNISFREEYSAVCGFTEAEVRRVFAPEVSAFARKWEVSEEEMLTQLRETYDGYHFSCDPVRGGAAGILAPGVYNPVSLALAFDTGVMDAFWTDTGPSRMVNNFVSDNERFYSDYEGFQIQRLALQSSEASVGLAPVVLYQAGYLTLRASNETHYTLGVANNEVRQTMYSEDLRRMLRWRFVTDVLTEQDYLLRSLVQGDVPRMMSALRRMVAWSPYSNEAQEDGGKVKGDAKGRAASRAEHPGAGTADEYQRMGDMPRQLLRMQVEYRYQLIISVVFHMVGLRVTAEQHMGGGRPDIVVDCQESRYLFPGVGRSPYVFVFELKRRREGGLRAAVKQMLENHYLDPWLGKPGVRVVGVCIELHDKGKGLLAWKRVGVDTPMPRLWSRVEPDPWFPEEELPELI